MTLVAVLAALALAQAPRPELVLWHSYRATEAEALEKVVEQINRDEARFSVSVLAVPYDAYLDKISAAIPRGKGPDVFIAAHDTIGDWAEAKLLVAMDPVLDPTFSAGLLPGLVDAVLYKGTAWGVPLAFKSVALFRNTKLAPDPPETLDDLERMAKAVTGDGRYGLVYENRLLYFHAPFLFGFGGRLFDDNGKPALTDPKNIESARYAMRLQRELAIVPQETNGALITSLFNEGRAAMFIAGPWSLGELSPDIAVDVSRLPAVSALPGAARLRPFVSVEAAFVSTRSQHPALSVELVRLLASEGASRARLVDGLQPVARRETWKALEGAGIAPPLSLLLAFKAQLPDTLPTPNTPAMKSVWSPVDNALGASLGQGLDPNETFAEAQTKVAEAVKGIETGPARGSSGAFAIFVLVALVLLVGASIVGVVRYGPKKLVTDARKQRIAYVYLLPAALCTGVLVFVPFFFGIGMGFFEHTWGTWTFVGLGNFTRILSGTGSFVPKLLFTMWWTASNVFFHVVIGVFLALILSQARLRYRGLYRALFILPWAVPSYITALIWKGMFHPELGAINQALGIPGFSWMNQAWSAYLANLITNVWLGFPFMMVTALGGLTAIPKDLYEAAALDGAGPVTRFFKITLPLLVPTLAPAVVLGTVWTFNMFNVIYLVSGGAPQGQTDILITEAFRWAFERGQGGAFGTAAAYSSMVFLLLLGYTTAASRVAKKIGGGQ